VSTTPIGLDFGSTWVFASAVDRPGWCRRGKGEDAAIAARLEFADRYRRVAGPGFRAGRPEVVGRVDGDAMTNFGAPGLRGPWDDERLDAAEVARQVGLLRSSWEAFDQATAPPRPCCPRASVAVDATATTWSSTSVRPSARTPAGSVCGCPRAHRGTEQRDKITAALMEERARPATTAWPPRYFIRRSAWYVLDHAWEMEDKSRR